MVQSLKQASEELCLSRGVKAEEELAMGSPGSNLPGSELGRSGRL